MGVVGQCLALVAPAEAAFRSRWQTQTLARIDPSLHRLLMEQETLYDAALVTGSDDEAREQSEAMVRGWRAAVQAMERADHADDAYFVGQDPATGAKVVIGQHKASVRRLQVENGQKVIFVTPDEVAKLVAGLEIIAEAKAIFPDAELLRVSPTLDMIHSQEKAA